MYPFLQWLALCGKCFSPHAEGRATATPGSPSGPASTNAGQSDTCTTQDNNIQDPTEPPPSASPHDASLELREAMVEHQLARRDIHCADVLQAMLTVTRHEFAPNHPLQDAYADKPLSIGHGQTISQPYIVALMTQLARPAPEARALDIGTGSGYQAAVLASLVHSVQSVECIPALAAQARRRLQRMGYANINVHTGDGTKGWPERSPYDIIIAAAAPDRVPPALLEQLAPGGRLIIPIGVGRQFLMLYEKQADGMVVKSNIAQVAFVPMIGNGNGDSEL